MKFLRSENLEISSIKIVSITGQLLYEDNYNNIINLECLKSGVYFIIGRNKEKIVFTKKIIKQ